VCRAASQRRQPGGGVILDNTLAEGEQRGLRTDLEEMAVALRVQRAEAVGKPWRRGG
jgi:hypothetical protein